MIAALTPRYPQIHVTVRSQNPLALVGAVRHALRLAGLERRLIRHFSTEALATDDPSHLRQICGEWVDIEAPS